MVPFVQRLEVTQRFILNKFNLIGGASLKISEGSSDCFVQRDHKKQIVHPDNNVQDNSNCDDILTKYRRN